MILIEPVFLAEVCLLLLAGAPAIDAREVAPIDLVLLVPASELGQGVSRSEIIRAVDETLAAHTSLRAEALDAELVNETCPEGKFGCFARRIVRSQLYAVVSVVALGEGSLRVAATLLDANRARACEANASEESCVIAKAILVNQPPQIAPANKTLGQIRSFFAERARSSFISAGVWEPYGSLVLLFAEDGFEVQLDGKAIGSSSKPSTRIERVLPGPRKVQLARGGVLSRPEVVRVERAKTASVAVMLDLETDGLRTALFYTGAATAVAGAAITTLSVIQASSRDHFVACIGSDPSCDTRFIGTGDPSDNPPLETSNGGRGVLLAPLGLALFGGGAAWSIGSLLGEQPDPPIIEMVIGVVVMAGTYATGALLGGGGP